MGTIAQNLAEFVYDLSFEDIPWQVVEKAKTCLLHNIGVSLAGLELAKIPIDTVKAISSGPGPCTVLVDGIKLGIVEAAYVNAALIHGRTQDDVHNGARTHVGATITPAVLAVAERENLSGKEFLTALIAGYEVAIAVGEPCAVKSTSRGFRATSLYGTIGAAAGAAKAFGLDQKATENAISLSTAQAGGTNQCWIAGSMEWLFEVGNAASGGIIAGLLAQMGGVGAPDAFEGDAGFFKAFVGEKCDQVLVCSKLKRKWGILEVDFKPYPVCGLNQTMVHLALSMIKIHSIQAENIKEVKVVLSVDAINYPGINSKGPFNDVSATLMSAQFCLSTAILNRVVKHAHLYEFRNKFIIDMLNRINLISDPNLNVTSCKIEIIMNDGEVIKDELIDNGDVFNLSWNEEKDVLKTILPEMVMGSEQLDNLIDIIANIDQLDNISTLIEATIPWDKKKENSNI